jgi:hypothetical protein
LVPQEVGDIRKTALDNEERSFYNKNPNIFVRASMSSVGHRLSKENG